MKKQFLTTLRAGDEVDDVFYVAEREARKTREGSRFFIFHLRDRTGTMRALLFEPLSGKRYANKGEFARVKGRVDEYNQRLNLKIDEIKPGKEADIEYRDFLPSTERNVDECYQRLLGTAKNLREPLAALLTSFFGNATFERQFKLAPAGIRAHHAYLGGLCIHTFDMLEEAHALCKLDKNLDRDLLYAGVLLHDVGKIREYNYTRSIDNSTEGKLLGHIVIGVRMVERELERMPDFPEKLAWKLLHMTISHHGLKEYGSPRRPLFLEAEVLHQLDNFDAKRAMYKEIAAQSDEDAVWSEYHPFLEHDTYLPRDV